MVKGVPLRVLFWKGAHRIANTLAWKYARPAGPEEGIALRIDQRHPLWRLNSWCARGWSPWWIEEQRRRMRCEPDRD